MVKVINPVVRLMKRPASLPVDREHLVYSQEEIEVHESDLKLGQLFVRNLYLGIDPAARTWMDFDKRSYLPPVKLGEVMRGATIGQVILSRSGHFNVGDLVNGYLDAGGWCGYAICSDDSTIEKLSPSKGVPIRAYLGVLGGTGLTAYFGLIDIGCPEAGQTIVVSAAAGATGSVVCQIAKNVYNCRVIGIAGGEEKCSWLLNVLNIDAAIDYKEGGEEEFEKSFKTALQGKGVDVFFDNVGGWILNSILKRINYKARIVLCGAISSYNQKGLPPGPGNYLNLITKSARMEGFVLLNYAKQYQKAKDDITKWIQEGKIQYIEDITFGLMNATKALLKLFGYDGGNKGKVIVEIFPQHHL